jgi:hypothetical protein
MSVDSNFILEKHDAVCSDLSSEAFDIAVEQSRKRRPQARLAAGQQRGVGGDAKVDSAGVGGGAKVDCAGARKATASEAKKNDDTARPRDLLLQCASCSELLYVVLHVHPGDDDADGRSERRIGTFSRHAGTILCTTCSARYEARKQTICLACKVSKLYSY